MSPLNCWNFPARRATEIILINNTLQRRSPMHITYPNDPKPLLEEAQKALLLAAHKIEEAIPCAQETTQYTVPIRQLAARLVILSAERSAAGSAAPEPQADTSPPKPSPRNVAAWRRPPAIIRFDKGKWSCADFEEELHAKTRAVLQEMTESYWEDQRRFGLSFDELIGSPCETGD